MDQVGTLELDVTFVAMVDICDAKSFFTIPDVIVGLDFGRIPAAVRKTINPDEVKS
jgi:hypothetical protein